MSDDTKQNYDLILYQVKEVKEGLQRVEAKLDQQVTSNVTRGEFKQWKDEIFELRMGRVEKIVYGMCATILLTVLGWILIAVR